MNSNTKSESSLDPKGVAGNKKAPLHLIPPTAMEKTAWAHKLGADKYGPYNWRNTRVCATIYIAAMMRHLNAWRDGEDLDPESGITHLAHVVASCNILMDAAACNTLEDDRYRKPIQDAVLTEDHWMVCRKCQGKKEHHYSMGWLCPKCEL